MGSYRVAHVRSAKSKLCNSLSGLKRKYLSCLVIAHSFGNGAKRREQWTHSSSIPATLFAVSSVSVATATRFLTTRASLNGALAPYTLGVPVPMEMRQSIGLPASPSIYFFSSIAKRVGLLAPACPASTRFPARRFSRIRRKDAKYNGAADVALAASQIFHISCTPWATGALLRSTSYERSLETRVVFFGTVVTKH